MNYPEFRAKCKANRALEKEGQTLKEQLEQNSEEVAKLSQKTSSRRKKLPR